MKIDHDAAAEAVYVQISRGEIVRTVALFGDAVMADLDETGRLLGVEVLGSPVTTPSEVR